jgi:prephenate dehydratase
MEINKIKKIPDAFLNSGVVKFIRTSPTIRTFFRLIGKILSFFLPIILGLLAGLFGVLIHRYLVNWYVPVGFFIACILIFSGAVISRYNNKTFGSVIYLIVCGGFSYYLSYFSNAGTVLITGAALDGEKPLAGYIGLLYLTASVLIPAAVIFIRPKYFIELDVDDSPKNARIFSGSGTGLETGGFIDSLTGELVATEIAVKNDDDYNLSKELVPKNDDKPFKQIGYLGPEGSFSHQAAIEFSKKHKLPNDPSSWYGSEIELFKGLVSGEIEYIAVPFENSIEGFVFPVIDMLIENDIVFAIDKLDLPVKFNAFNKKGANLLTRVSAHPHALAQCKNFINRSNLRPLPAASNSAACANIDYSTVAIGPAICKEYYDLEIFEENVGDFENAETQFMLVKKVDLPKATTIGLNSFSPSIVEDYQLKKLDEILAEAEDLTVSSAGKVSSSGATATSSAKVSSGGTATSSAKVPSSGTATSSGTNPSASRSTNTSSAPAKIDESLKAAEADTVVTPPINTNKPDEYETQQIIIPNEFFANVFTKTSAANVSVDSHFHGNDSVENRGNDSVDSHFHGNDKSERSGNDKSERSGNDGADSDNSDDFGFGATEDL